LKQRELGEKNKRERVVKDWNVRQKIEREKRTGKTITSTRIISEVVLLLLSLLSLLLLLLLLL